LKLLAASREELCSAKQIFDPNIIPIVLANPAPRSGEPSLRAQRSKCARGIQPKSNRARIY
jgi:hypothetical protein